MLKKLCFAPRLASLVRFLPEIWCQDAPEDTDCTGEVDAQWSCWPFSSVVNRFYDFHLGVLWAFIGAALLTCAYRRELIGSR